ncbi:MAG: DUF1289 domain-containing protein [Porticoccaceae bacterium]|nr:DUF1289 domain-containing protein [Porticoccaceae bacterium]
MVQNQKNSSIKILATDENQGKVKARSGPRSQTAKTPCIGICSSGIGDNVCRGCMRFEHEVIRWNGYSLNERQCILDRIDSFLIQIVKNKLELIDFNKLKFEISSLKVPCNEAWSPHRLLYELLRLCASQIVETQSYGFRLTPEVAHLSLVEIKRDIEVEWHALSNAHYERYIAPGLVGPVV